MEESLLFLALVQFPKDSKIDEVIFWRHTFLKQV